MFLFERRAPGTSSWSDSLHVLTCDVPDLQGKAHFKDHFIRAVGETSEHFVVKSILLMISSRRSKHLSWGRGKRDRQHNISEHQLYDRPCVYIVRVWSVPQGPWTLIYLAEFRPPLPFPSPSRLPVLSSFGTSVASHSCSALPAGLIVVGAVLSLHLLLSGGVGFENDHGETVSAPESFWSKGLWQVDI